MANYPTLWLFLMMDEVNNTNTLSLRVDITRWRTLKLTHKLSKDITTIWALRLTNEYLKNKLSRNNITTIWGLCNMFKVGLELLEMSLNRLGKQKSRYIKNLPVGASSLVGPDVLPISPDVRYCSYSTRTFSNLQKRPNNSFSSSQWPPTVIYG